MNLLGAYLFITVVAECIAKFFYSSKRSINPISVIIFLLLAPVLLSSQRLVEFRQALFMDADLVSRCLTAVAPLVLASLVFAAIQGLISLSVSKELSLVFRVFKPIWLVCFLVVVVRNFAPIASTILLEAPKP